VSHKIFPYHPPRALSENLWQVEGSLPLPVPRNMTIWRAPDGRLVLYSVVAMHDDGMRALDQLGRPAFMVIPHKRHHMDAPFYKERYPWIRTLAETTEPANGVAIDGSMQELRTLGVAAERIPGTNADDIALDVPLSDGRALCVCELLSNVAPPNLIFKLAGRLIGPPRGSQFGVARIVRRREVEDADRLRAWFTSQAERRDLRMLLFGHGAPIVNDVAAALTLAATQV
jgi:hypothetical protein